MGLCASGPEDVQNDFDGSATGNDSKSEDHEKTKGGSLIIHRRMSKSNPAPLLAEEAVIDTTKGGSMLINQRVLQYA